MKFSKLAADGTVDMRMPGPVDVSAYSLAKHAPLTSPSFAAARPRASGSSLSTATGKSMWDAPWRGSVIKPALRERLMHYSPKNMIARSPLARNMPNSEQAADLRRFYATDEYARLSSLAKPGTGAWRYGGPVERMVVNPGHVDGTPHVGVGTFGGQGMRDQVVGSLGLAASAIMPGAAKVPGPLGGRALGGFFRGLAGSGMAAANAIDAYSSFSDAAKEVGTTPGGAISLVSGAVDALPSIGVNVESPKLKRGLSAIAAGQALRGKEQGPIGTAAQAIAMPAVIGTELAKKLFDNTGRRLVVDSLKPIKAPANLLRGSQTSGLDASGLADKYLPRDFGPMLQKGRDVYDMLKKRGLKVNVSMLQKGRDVGLDVYDMLKKRRGLNVNGHVLLDDRYFQRDGGIHEREPWRGSYGSAK